MSGSNKKIPNMMIQSLNSRSQLESNENTPRKCSEASGTARAFFPGNLKYLMKREKMDKTWRDTFLNFKYKDGISRHHSRVSSMIDSEVLDTNKINAKSLPRIIISNNQTMEARKKFPSTIKHDDEHLRSASKSRYKFSMPFSIHCLEASVPHLVFKDKQKSDILFHELKHDVVGSFVISTSYHQIESSIHAWMAHRRSLCASIESTEIFDLTAMHYALLYFHWQSVSIHSSRSLSQLYQVWLMISDNQASEYAHVLAVNKKQDYDKMEVRRQVFENKLTAREDKIERLMEVLKKVTDERDKLQKEFDELAGFDGRAKDQASKFLGLAKQMKEKAKTYKQRYMKVMNKNLTMKIKEGHAKEALAIEEVRGITSLAQSTVNIDLISPAKMYYKRMTSTINSPKSPLAKFHIHDIPEKLSASISEADKSMMDQYQEGIMEFHNNMDRLDQLCVDFNMFPDGKKFIAHKSTQTDTMVSQACQTAISCVDIRFDKVMQNQESIDRAVKECELREQMENAPGIEVVLDLLNTSDLDGQSAMRLAISEIPESIRLGLSSTSAHRSPFSLPELQDEINLLRGRQSVFYWKALEAYTSKSVAFQDLVMERKILTKVKEKLSKDKVSLESRLGNMEKELKSKESILQKINLKFVSDTTTSLNKDLCLKLIKEVYEEKAREDALLDNELQLQASKPGESNNQLEKNQSSIKQKVKFAVNQKKRTALSIIENVRLGREKRGKYYVPVKQTLKCITAIYTERLKEAKMRENKNDQVFGEYVYDYYVKSFGFITIAEPKLISFIISIKNNRNKPRISLFSKFIGIDPIEEYSIEDLNKYVEAFDFLTSGANVHTVNNSDMDADHYAPYVRCVEYVRKFGDEMNLPQSDIADMRKEVDKLRTDMKAQNNRISAVNIDIFIESVVRRYRAIIDSTKQSVVNAFVACDLDGNMFVSINEFVMLWRYLNTDTFDREKAERIFDSKSDKQLDDETAMTFDRFCSVAAEMCLFTEDRQCVFLGIEDKKECKEKFKNFKKNWTKIKEGFELAINEIGGQDAVEIDWEYIIDSLDDRMLKCDEKEMPGLLISARMLECELVRALEELDKDPTSITKSEFKVLG